MHALLLCRVRGMLHCPLQKSHVLGSCSCHLRRHQKGMDRHSVLGLASMRCGPKMQMTAVPAL